MINFFTQFETIIDLYLLIYRLQQYLNCEKLNYHMDANSLVTENLYQLPQCSICLCEMTSDLSSLACGHVFHIECIAQHFQYKGTCPNCQKRAQTKEIRLVVFPVVHNTKTGAYLQALLKNIDKSEGQQVQGLLMQIKNLSEKKQKYENQIKQYQKDTKKKNEQVEKIKREIQIKSNQAAILAKQNRDLKRELKDLKQVEQKLRFDMIQIRTNYDILYAQKKQIEQYKLLQRAALDNSEELLKYKNEHESKKTPPETMCKQFFQMLLLKNLNILKLKQKQKEYNDKYRYKQQQITKLKTQIQNLKKEIEQGQNLANKWKGKCEKVRDKYVELAKKSRTQQSVNEMGQLEENSLSISLGFASKINSKINSSLPVQKNEKQLTFNIVQKPKATQQKFSFGSTQLKKQAEEKKQMTLKNFMF